MSGQPAACCFLMRCSKVPVLQLANVLSTEALFYACIFPFIAFFGSFAFVLYPLRDVLHPTGRIGYPSPCAGYVFAPEGAWRQAYGRNVHKAYAERIAWKRGVVRTVTNVLPLPCRVVAEAAGVGGAAVRGSDRDPAQLDVLPLLRHG